MRNIESLDRESDTIDFSDVDPDQLAQNLENINLYSDDDPEQEEKIIDPERTENEDWTLWSVEVASWIPPEEKSLLEQDIEELVVWESKESSAIPEESTYEDNDFENPET